MELSSDATVEQSKVMIASAVKLLFMLTLVLDLSNATIVKATAGETTAGVLAEK